MFLEEDMLHSLSQAFFLLPNGDNLYKEESKEDLLSSVEVSKASVLMSESHHDI